MNGADGNPNSGLSVSQQLLVLLPLQYRQVRAQAQERAQGLGGTGGARAAPGKEPSAGGGRLSAVGRLPRDKPKTKEGGGTAWSQPLGSLTCRR